MIGFILFLFGWLVLSVIAVCIWGLVQNQKKLDERLVTLQNQIDEEALSHQVDVIHLERQVTELEHVARGKILRIH